MKSIVHKERDIFELSYCRMPSTNCPRLHTVLLGFECGGMTSDCVYGFSLLGELPNVAP